MASLARAVARRPHLPEGSHVLFPLTLGHLQVICSAVLSRRPWGSKQQMRILIVEDEARIRAFLARAFEAEGFGVDVVADGERGLARALSGTTTS